MKVERTTVTMLEIIDAPRLDRIKVITEDFGKGQGQLTVICFGRAWTSYWGGMHATVAVFVASMSAEYIAENLLHGMQAGLKRNAKHEQAYLERIVKAVQEALRRKTRNELHGTPLDEASPDWEGA